MRTTLLTSTASGLLGLALSAGAAPPAPFAAIAERYAPIHRALVADSLAGIPDNARAIAAAVRALEADFSPDRAGVPAGRAADLRKALPEIAAAADRLAAAGDLAAARAAFDTMTRPLVLYRGMVDAARPAVAWCPMERKSWLQADGPIENPYDPSMLRCGEIVAR